jgi:putative oxidoreductase
VELSIVLAQSDVVGGNADATNAALLIARATLGAMLFAHGWRHVAAVRSGPGMANWFENLGLRPGGLHAWNVTISELVVGAMLVVGVLTPLGYGGLAAILLVALITNHRKNGFFIDSPGQGWEYVGVTAAVAVALGALGPGAWSLDDAVGIDFPFEPDTALIVSAALAILGTAAFLAAFWRPRETAR